MGLCMSSSEPREKLKKWIEEEIQSHEVVIWSKSWCGYCARTKAAFQNPDFSKIDVQVHELDQHPDGGILQELLEAKTCQSTVPNVWVKGKFIGGNDEAQRALTMGEIHLKLGVKR